MFKHGLGLRHTAALLGLALFAVALAACDGGGDDPTATSSTGQPTATSQPVTTNLPAPKGAVGTITIAVARVNSHPGINSAQGGETSVFWGAGESLFMTDTGPEFGLPWLATEWEVASDLSKVTITLEEGVQFHKGRGEMTAEDVAWSINDANATTNTESIHAQAGDLAAYWNAWTAVDTYVVEAPFKQFDPRWQTNGLSDGFQVTGIFSKKVFDEMGRDWMLENTIMTGPFEVEEWTDGDKAVLNAVQGHWRKTPEIDKLTYVQIPEGSIRLASMQNGEVDAAALDLKDIPGLQANGFELSGTSSGSELNIAWAGNIWEKTHAKTGEPLARPGADYTKPWIGNPDDAESMENARKVRWALAMAYDREEMNEVLAAGQGWTHGIGYFNPRMPQYQEKWDVPYDVDLAKQYLEDAGVGDGFAIEIFGQADTAIRAESAEAIGQYWAANLGLDVTVQSFEYSVFRPSIVDRSASIPFMNSCDDGRFPRPWDWPIGLVTSSLSRGGFSCSVEAPEIAQAYLANSLEPDIQKRNENNNDIADFYHKWMLMSGVFTFPVVLPYNPRAIESWEMRPSLSGPISSPALIVPASR